MIDFGTNGNWIYRSEWVEFAVVSDGNRIICKVSREAIDDHYGDSDSDTERLDKAKLHFDEITDLVGHKIGLMQFESDGAIVIKSEDW